MVARLGGSGRVARIFVDAFSNPETLRAKGVAGHEFVKATYDWDVMVGAC